MTLASDAKELANEFVSDANSAAIMTSLSTYLTARDETQTAFAARAGLTDSTLSRVLKGKSPPSPDVVERVREATAGEVTANDLYDAWRRARSGAGASAEAASAGGEAG